MHDASLAYALVLATCAINMHPIAHTSFMLDSNGDGNAPTISTGDVAGSTRETLGAETFILWPSSRSDH